MADARRRAQRSEGAGPSPHPAPAASGERIELPDSGLAEDILRRLEGGRNAPTEPAPASEAAPAAEAPGRIELPPSGLASDILARQDASAVPGRPAGRAAEPAAGEVPAPAEARDAQNLSFFAAPVREQRTAVEATEHLATFFLDSEEYGVDVRQVQEIRRVTEITTVPRAPEFVRGVINLRGRILPVLDLKRKLGLGDVALERASRIVVVRVRERRLGLLVDGASQVLKVPVSRIEAAPDEVIDKGGDYIRGVAKLDDRLIILIDLERALAHELRGTAAPVAPAEDTGARDGDS
jgi:purine-binding chemotaxis protein CheW